MMPGRNKGTIVFGGVFGGAVLLGSLLGAYPTAVTLGEPTASALNVVLVDGYEVDNSPISAASFPGNRIVVVADVVAVLPARWNASSRTEPDSPSFIFTPVRVHVIELLRGELRAEAGELIIRRLGGRVGDDEFVFSPDIMPGGLEPGNRVLLFLGEQRDLGDGLDAATPNMAYVVDAGGNATTSDGRWSIDLAKFKQLIRS